MRISPDFFVLNGHTEFSFPHNNCDHISDEELHSLLFNSYHLPEFLTKYYVARFGAASGSVGEIVKALYNDEEFGLVARCYMRLKFVLEVLHVPSLMKRLRDVPLRLAAERGDWFKASVADERVWRIDCLATWLFNYMIQSVEARCAGNVGNVALEVEMRERLERLNRAIQSVRAQPCGPFKWANVAPNDLVIYPFLFLVKGLWSAIEPVFTTEFSGFGGCSTVTGWNFHASNNSTTDTLS